MNSGVSGTNSGTGSGAVTVGNGSANTGTLAGSGNITTSSGVTVNGGRHAVVWSCANVGADSYRTRVDLHRHEHLGERKRG